MKLVIGLGNPGSKYENTRHNIGFMVIDAFAQKHNASFSLETKFKGMISQVNLNGQKAILLKPMTYMNLSGESIIKVMQFYKIDPSDILVISDDLDSRLGRVRIRDKGSDGGHNGLKSIVSHIKTEEYKRIKIGIDRSTVIPVIDWVLKKFTSDELLEVSVAIDKASIAIEEFISGTEFMKIASLYSSK
ncbi:MAG: aminoacyl-tRNA hydrolase [Erysipelotrichaceae bacterium]|nr:aminoacyl-tRNA hydrolase [Erysipelotrichaceae bacterium]